MADSEVRNRLLQHFAAVSSHEQTPIWDKAWQEGLTPWDRNAASPALRDTLESHSDLWSGRSANERRADDRLKALVPGCGGGYDVVLLASFGFDAYGLDVSPTAIDKAKSVHSDAAFVEENYALAGNVKTRGHVSFLLGDFFTNEAFKGLGGPQFDLIFDYTFLCALPPDLRPKWAKRMSELLGPKGTLVCVEFPLNKAPHLPGPPHGLSSELYVQLFRHPGERVEYDDDKNVRPTSDTNLSPDALIRADRWKASRTHAAGQGIDHVSLWRHATS